MKMSDKMFKKMQKVWNDEKPAYNYTIEPHNGCYGFYWHPFRTIHAAVMIFIEHPSLCTTDRICSKEFRFYIFGAGITISTWSMTKIMFRLKNQFQIHNILIDRSH